jgi:uncharacterized protein (TIGR03083 family)
MRADEMDVPALIAVLRSAGQSLGDTAERAELTATVPTCPGWTVRDLLLHVSGVHRWAATIVGEARTEPISLEQPHDIFDDLPDDDGLLDWYRAGHTDLVKALEQAPDTLACWTFLPARSPLTMWARRQAHETTIHRGDVEAAANLPPTVAPEVAIDGIDELLTCFVSGRSRRPRAKTESTVHVQVPEADAHWLIRIGPDRPHAERVTGTVNADTTVTGTASDVYLGLWNRIPWTALTVTGKDNASQLAELWSAGVHVRWS